MKIVFFSWKSAHARVSFLRDVRKSYPFSKLDYFSKFHIHFTPMNSFPSSFYVLNHALSFSNLSRIKVKENIL